MKTVLVVLCLLLPQVVSASWQDWFQRRDQQAEHALQQGEYDAAAAGFQDAYRRGVVYYRAGQYAAALASFEAVQRPEVADAALYNSANSHYQLGQYAEALKSYERLLARRPNHQDALHNHRQTLKKLGRFLPEDPPEPPEKDPENKDDDPQQPEPKKPPPIEENKSQERQDESESEEEQSKSTEQKDAKDEQSRAKEESETDPESATGQQPDAAEESEAKQHPKQEERGNDRQRTPNKSGDGGIDKEHKQQDESDAENPSITAAKGKDSDQGEHPQQNRKDRIKQGQQPKDGHTQQDQRDEQKKGLKQGQGDNAGPLQQTASGGNGDNKEPLGGEQKPLTKADELMNRAVELFDQLGFADVPNYAAHAQIEDGDEAKGAKQGEGDGLSISDSLAEQLLDRIEGNQSKPLRNRFAIGDALINPETGQKMIEPRPW